MPRGDSSHPTPIHAREAAKGLREAAEFYWRFAEQTPDPDRYRYQSLAMDYHHRALLLEHGVIEP